VARSESNIVQWMPYLSEAPIRDKGRLRYSRMVGEGANFMTGQLLTVDGGVAFH
jgi:hypothetical protein